LKETKKDWDEIWHKSNIQKEIKQIEYETAYTSSLQKLFSPKHLVLEAGCGFGRYSFWLEGKGINSIGIEIVRKAVRVGKEFAKLHRFQSPLIIGDVTKLPFRNSIFDGYVSLGVIEHFRFEKEIKDCFNEMHRVLKIEGKSFISVPNPLAIHNLLQRIFILTYFFRPYSRCIHKKDLILYSNKFRVLKVSIGDFYYSYYLLFKIFLRKDLWRLKSILQRSLNVFDKVPLFREMGSGIFIILEKPPNDKRGVSC